MKPKPLQTFKLYPDRRKYFYFTALIFATRQEMYEAKAKLSPLRASDYDAITLGRYQMTSDNRHMAAFRRRNKWSKRRSKVEREYARQLGSILFFKERLGVGVVSHEMTHAATGYVKIVGIKGGDAETRDRSFALLVDSNDDYEECLAWTIGELTAQFFARYKQ